MPIFGHYVELPYIIIGAAIIFTLLVLIIISIIKSEKPKKDEDFDTIEEFGDFHGLLSKEDFDTKCDDPMLEIYRMNWIKAEQGDKKDNYLLLYLAMKKLNEEQDASEEEWTQEQCEARMDELINELSKKTGLKLIVEEIAESEYEEYQIKSTAIKNYCKYITVGMREFFADDLSEIESKIQELEELLI